MNKTLILVGALLLVIAIIWWFFGKRKITSVAAVRSSDIQTVEITVDGGYKPAVVELERGVKANLVFIRKDKSSCFEEVVLPDFGVRTHLPVDKPFTITVNPDKAGEYKYACGMNMFFGKVIVK
jgi:plastocyanin domain-containing protein